MKNIFILTAIFSLFATKSFAKIQDDFFFKPSLSIEYSASRLTDGSDKFFKTNNFGKQFSGFENIALGGNFRVHKFLGFNANWVRGAMNNESLGNAGFLYNKARYKFEQYNLSALAYFPANKFVEFFVEAGASDIRSRLNYVENDGTIKNYKSHNIKALYGLGLQFKLCEKSDDAIRLTFQKYSGKLALLDANYSTIRIGYLKAF